jgi:hypothetical protein
VRCAVAALLLLALAAPLEADTAKPVSVAQSFAWVALPVAADYGATAYCISHAPGCHEANPLTRSWVLPASIAVQTFGDRWLSTHSRGLMWASRIARIAYHGVLAFRALQLAARRGR